jgi:apoptosis-inducing factor 3
VSGEPELTGPDLTVGVPLSDISDGGMLSGHAFGKPVLLARTGDTVTAVGGACTHYGAPLADGLRTGDLLRCPWHHACFDLRTGEAVRAPALNPLPRYRVERRGGQVVVTGELGATERRVPARTPGSVVIIGAGAAGDAAADMLRREGYTGIVTLIGDDRDPPCDRPNLSKDYLAGNAPEEWIPLRPAGFYDERRIELVRGRRVTAIDTRQRFVALDDGSSLGYDALLLATGASPTRLPSSVDSTGRVLYLRTLADSRAIIAAAAQAKTAIVIGASFIGLEVAASLRARGLDVSVVAPEQVPLERVLGPELGSLVRSVHEAKGVRFHLGRSVTSIDARAVVLDDGTALSGDIVVAGVGVRPNDSLGADAGLRVDRGIVVDQHLETSVSGIYAAGDVARYPDPITGTAVRIEHWAVAQRQGQVAARNILGARQRFHSAPFFWSQHFDMTIGYVGHADAWDEIAIDGSVQDRDCTVRYRAHGRTLAVATIGRDLESLQAELAIESQIARAVA